jgi:hypothetical protein
LKLPIYSGLGCLPAIIHDQIAGHIGSNCPRDWHALGVKNSRTALVIKRTDNATHPKWDSVVACSLNLEVIDSSEPR